MPRLLALVGGIVLRLAASIMCNVCLSVSTSLPHTEKIAADSSVSLSVSLVAFWSRHTSHLVKSLLV